MLNKILNTFFTRILSTLLMFVVVIINTNTFGAEGTGTIALVILGLTLLQVLSNFIGGSTLVYLTPQKNNFQLLLLSYIWSIISNIGGLGILYWLNLIPREFATHLLILTFIYSAYYTHVSIMQGKEDIKIFNLYQLIQVVLLITTLVSAILISRSRGNEPEISLYIYAYTFSYLVPTLASCFYISKRISRTSCKGMWKLAGEMLKLGFWTQLANLTQLLTYRLNYYLVKGFIGRKPLGIYDLGTKLSEAVWIFPKSICLVQYARISNNHEDEYAKMLTLSLLKIVFVFSILSVLFLLALPASFIASIFGPEFIHSKPVICSLLPGIVFLSCMTIISHHFAGYGKYWINAIGSVIGLVVTAILGFTFIPATTKHNTLLALQTAGWITSCAYLASLVFSIICFFRFTTVQWRDFLITRRDWRLLKEIIGNKIHSIKTRTQ